MAGAGFRLRQRQCQGHCSARARPGESRTSVRMGNPTVVALTPCAARWIAGHFLACIRQAMAAAHICTMRLRLTTGRWGRCNQDLVRLVLTHRRARGQGGAA